MLKRFLLAFLFLSGCAHECDWRSPGAPCPPPAPREFRAAWVATVENIDWPSRPGLPSSQQQREIVQILDKAKAIGLNAIILQVRSSCDAIYPSPYEPWSFYLTGTQGRPPQPIAYDPLQTWVTEAHRRGIELHAWFNPFRAKGPGASYQLAASHITRTQPNLVKTYGTSLWLDPGEPAARNLALGVILDVVRRYDIDGIHIDDYFYPYPQNDAAGKPIGFPDDASWSRYVQTGGRLSRGDWRRTNVNDLVFRIYTETKALKRWVKVGISPFGIWRPGNPPTVKGFDAYEGLYADSRWWLEQGWCDYFSPQIYWRLNDPPKPPFADLLKWWIEQNPHGRNLWPGLYTSQIKAAGDGWTPKDIGDQIEISRRAGAGGHVHFSMITLMQDRKGIDEKLRAIYPQPALVPASPWLGDHLPVPPRFSAQFDSKATLHVNWETDGTGGQPWLCVVYVKYGDAWRTGIYPATERQATIAPDARLGLPTAVTVSAVDRVGNESRQPDAIQPSK